MTAFESVEAAVGVFLEKLKIHGVVLDAVAVPVAEDAQAGLFIHEKKSAEIGIELLNAGAGGDEIVAVAEIMELHFDERFFEAEMIIETVGAETHVRTDNAKLTDVEIIETELRSNADAPIHRLERCVPMEKVETEAQSLVDEDLLAAAKKTGTASLGGAYSARRWNASAVKKCFRRNVDVQKYLLAEKLRPDGLVALEAVAIERVVPVRPGVGILALLQIPPIVGLIERPAIGHHVVDIGHGRQIIGCEFEDVIRIGIETVTKFVMTTARGQGAR